MRRTARIAVLCLAAVTLAAGCGEDSGGGDRDPADSTGPVVRIGTKDFTEQFLLGELYGQALRAKGFRVALKSNIGNSEITHAALRTNGIDMYPEYVGVLLSEIAERRDRPEDPQAAYLAAKAFEERSGFTLLQRTPFSDQNALAVTPAFARKEGVRTIADLRRLRGTVRVGAPPEFATRYEGILGLRSVYRLRRLKAVPLKIPSQYEALTEGRVQVAAVFTTAGQLAGGRYVQLRDPEGLFANQQVAPVISRRTVRAGGPRLVRTIDAVSRALTTAAMREMNAAVDLRGGQPRAVARRFLIARGLLGPGRTSNTE